MSTKEPEGVHAMRAALLEEACAEAALKAARTHTRTIAREHARELHALGWAECERAIGTNEHGKPLITQDYLRGLARPALP